MPKTEVILNHHQIIPDFDLAEAAKFAAKEVAGALGYWAIKNQGDTEAYAAEQQGFAINSVPITIAKDGPVKQTLKKAVAALIKRLKDDFTSNGQFIAFAELSQLTKRLTNHASAQAGNVITRVIVWEDVEASTWTIAVQVSVLVSPPHARDD